MPIVYILTNESMPDTVKIGFTDNISRRLKELDNTSTPLPFECFYALQIDDARAVEDLLHEAFHDKRIRKNREFFTCSPEQAKSALRIAEMMGAKDVTPSKLDGISSDDKKALEDAKSRNKRVDYFSLLGIQIGEVLRFAKDEGQTCEVVENGRVLFRGEVNTLSGSALTLVSEMGYNWQQVRGAGYWCYKGITLLDLYRQSQEKY